MPRVRKALLVGVLLALAGFGSLATTSVAQTPGCAPASEPLWDLPNSVAYGRDLRVLLEPNESAQASSVDPAKPYASVVRREDAGAGVTRLVLPFGPQDGPVRLVLQRRQSDSCLQQTVEIAAVAPIAPRFSVQDDSVGIGGGASVRGIFFRVELPKSCFEAPPGALSLTIRDGRRLRSTTVVDSCVWYSDARIRASGFTLSPTRGFLGDTFVDDPRLIPRWASGSYHRLRYSFTLNRRPVQSGVLAIAMGDSRPIFVYEGSDDFQNYCRNRHRTIYQQGGRRYCVRVLDDDNSDGYYVTIKRDRKPTSLRRTQAARWHSPGGEPLRF